MDASSREKQQTAASDALATQPAPDFSSALKTRDGRARQLVAPKSDVGGSVRAAPDLGVWALDL